jgi:diphthamide synthase (EF-2-diphthine--ammonia ligase)
LVKEFKERGICPCGEKGEYHTLVVDGPIFKKPIKIIEAEAVIKESFWKHWFLDIKKYA